MDSQKLVVGDGLDNSDRWLRNVSDVVNAIDQFIYAAQACSGQSDYYLVQYGRMRALVDLKKYIVEHSVKPQN